MRKQPNPNALPEAGICTRQQIAEFCGVDVRTVDKWVAMGKFKKINSLGTKVVRFNAFEVRQSILS